MVTIELNINYDTLVCDDSLSMDALSLLAKAKMATAGKYTTMNELYCMGIREGLNPELLRGHAKELIEKGYFIAHYPERFQDTHHRWTVIRPKKLA